MSNEVLEKLAQLLEQDQFELIFTEQDIRLVYLMNDAVESFLVFQNVRILETTGISSCYSPGQI